MAAYELLAQALGGEQADGAGGAGVALGRLVPDVVVDERGRPCAVAVAFLPVCAVPVSVHLFKSR